MKSNIFVILSLTWFKIMEPKAASEHKPTGGARGKNAGAGLNAADVSGAVRIFGGNETAPHEFPFQLVFVKDGSFECGAVIIDSEWALTAAHCVDLSQPVKVYTVLAGKHDKTISESSEQIVYVVKIATHENYTYDSQDENEYNSTYNDIAAIKVSPPFQFNEYIQKIPLPQRRDESYSTGMATAVGWGGTETERPSKVTTLRKVTLPLMTNERCKELLDRYKPGSILPVHLCAGAEDGKSGCFGESGGPLLFMEDGKQVLIGLTSWGLQCGEENISSVFTRVTEFLDWIDNATGLDLSGRGDRPILIAKASGGAAEVRAKISNGLAQAMCKSFDDYQKEMKLAPAVKVRPKTPEMCGWAKWSQCKGERSGRRELQTL